MSQKVAVQADGKILVAGSAGSGTTDFAVVRYNANGSLDTSFGGGDGIVITDVAGGGDSCYGLVVQPDGKILVAGTALNVPAQTYQAALVRYLPDGTLDAGFGVGGKVLSDLALGDISIYALALQSDGRIVIGGSSETEMFAILRYLPNGMPDTSFSGDGMATVDVGTGAVSVAVQADGRILAGGNRFFAGESEMAVVRLTSTGDLDSSFGGDGVVNIDLPGTQDYHSAMALQPDGRIILVGEARVGIYPDTALVRLLGDGSLDASFGNVGVLITAIGGSEKADEAREVMVQADGKIVVTGSVDKDLIEEALMVARFHANGSLDTSFGGGLVIKDFGRSAYGSGMALQSDGNIVITGGYFDDSFNEKFMVVRLRGEADIWHYYDHEAAWALNYHRENGQVYLGLSEYYKYKRLSLYYYQLSLGDQAGAEFSFFVYRGKQLKFLYLHLGKPKLARYFENLELAIAYKRYWALKGNPKRGQRLFVKYRNIALAARR